MSRDIIAQVVATIGPASAACRDAARAKASTAGSDLLQRLAGAIAGAQHAPAVRATPRTIVVVAGDHGCGDPGIALGPAHPTAIAARAICDGSAALAQLARAASAPIVVVDAGVREPDAMPAAAIRLGLVPSADVTRGAALTEAAAGAAVEAGIALAVSLVEAERVAAFALGALGLGSELAAAALLAAATGIAPAGLGDSGAEAIAVRAVTAPGTPGLPRLAAWGGSDLGVLAGLMLAAASFDIPIILDGYATGVAALVAAELAPAVTGYLIAAHRGSFTLPATLAHLGLVPMLDAGLGHGEGAGAAMLLPSLDQVAALTASAQQ